LESQFKLPNLLEATEKLSSNNEKNTQTFSLYKKVKQDQNQYNENQTTFLEGCGEEGVGENYQKIHKIYHP
jgi:hypothetical protein